MDFDDMWFTFLFILAGAIGITISSIASNEILTMFGYSGFLEPAIECGGLTSEQT